MKLLFRRKSDGYILKPIQTLTSRGHVHSGLECLADIANLPANFDVLTHDIERGDVLRDMIGGRTFEAVRSEGWEWKGVGKWSIFDYLRKRDIVPVS